MVAEKTVFEAAKLAGAEGRSRIQGLGIKEAARILTASMTGPEPTRDAAKERGTHLGALGTAGGGNLDTRTARAVAPGARDPGRMYGRSLPLAGR